MSKLQCPVCGDDFDEERGVRKHSWDVHEACHLCGDTFDEQDELYRHWLEDHPDDLSTAAEKRAESAVGDRTVCPVCDQRMASINAVRDHAWDAHQVCHLCGEGFDDEGDLHTHWLVVHPSELSREGAERAGNDVGSPGFSERLSHGGPTEAVRGVNLSRRSVLTAAGVGAVGVLGYGVATALSGGGGSGGETAIGGHPATRALPEQPRLGPEPTAADGTIVAFEDPFCPACRRFELQSFPRLKRDYIDPGRVSFTFRGIPPVTRYSDTGVHALEATYDRRTSAFWKLKASYYENQPTITGENVESKTRTYLESIDGLDVTAIMDDVNNRRFGSEVKADRSAARDAGVRGTPTFFLFRGGSFVTDLVGPQSASALASALGL